MVRWQLLIGAVVVVASCNPAPRPGGQADDDAATGTCAASRSCSADLRSVVDCAGNVIATCAATEACANGTCLDACDAAAANASSIGCDYFAVDPDTIEPGGCFAAFVANTSVSPVTISVDLAGSALPVASFARIPMGQGQSLDYLPLVDGMLQPGQVAILFLAAFPGAFASPCPAGITPAVTDVDAAVHGTTLGQAFHIKTSAPVVAYDIAPYGGGNSALTSATLLLPSSAWDTNYVAVDAAPLGAGQPTLDIVALGANTHVTIRPVVAIDPGIGVAGGNANNPVTYTLAAGQVLQLTQNLELGGSPITADQPIGVWGGASCMYVPTLVEACDGAHQQIPPVRAMGSRYAAVRYRNRFANQEETVPWRLVGGVDGTTLSYTPAPPPGAPTSLALGEVVDLESPGPFTVQSQDADHPFYMAGYMTGCVAQDPDILDCRGDPEFVNLVPPAQYLSAYTFFTDPTYPETNLVLTREQQGGTFADVTVDCAGTVTGWQPIDAADTIEYARLDLVTGNFEGVGNCNNGLHSAASALPFGLVVWGWGSAATGGSFGMPGYSQAVSYAYPAGARIRPINHVVIE